MTSKGDKPDNDVREEVSSRIMTIKKRKEKKRKEKKTKTKTNTKLTKQKTHSLLYH